MDTIAEFLVNIKNAKEAGKDKVDIPASRMRKALAEIMKSKGWIKDFRVADDGKQGLMRVYLSKQGPYATQFRRISRPGRRIYVGWEDIRPVRSGKGFAIVSTNKGVIVDSDARKSKVGGELICELW